MLVGRVLDVGAKGPVTALQTFLAGLLRASGATHLLAPAATEPGRVDPKLMSLRAVLSHVNPLLPLMQADAAGALLSAVRGAPEETVVAVLRPCEVRATSGLARQGKLDLGRVIVVGIDCLGTYEPAYWSHGNPLHVDRPDWLVEEALKLAQLGQAPAEGCRLACELCDQPAADYRAADLLIGLVGVPNQERLLVLAEADRDKRWRLEALTSRLATEREAVDREVTLWRLADRRREGAAARLARLGLANADSGVIMDHMRKCTLCGECIDLCPQWSRELREALDHGRGAFIGSLLNSCQRLAGCSDCGMCQVQCVEGIPLSAILRVLSRAGSQRVRQVSGRTMREARPWTS
jgi:formate dehydrogenase subunit beta